MDDIRVRIQQRLTKEQHEALERAGITVETNPGAKPGDDPSARGEPPTGAEESTDLSARVRVSDENVPAEARKRVARALGWDPDDDRLQPA